MSQANRSMLVGDIGGTHARFAVVDVSGSEPSPIHDLLDLDSSFERFSQALEAYFTRAGLAKTPSVAAIAVAGPVTAGEAHFTNRNWHICESELQDFGFAEVYLINDFAALACVADHLSADDLQTIGPELPGLADKPISIVGAGTGFGVACLARYRDRAVPLATEGGHVGFAPQDDQEIAVLRALASRFGRVSVERILSGPGLENLHWATERISGHQTGIQTAPEIVRHALSGDADCHAALTLFCAIFGAVAGDVALTHGAQGGVFVAGGIAQKIARFLAQSTFRTRFESKGRLSEYVKSIPTKLIVNSNATLRGAVRAALEFRS
jgi:glucokinase